MQRRPHVMENWMQEHKDASGQLWRRMQRYLHLRSGRQTLWEFRMLFGLKPEPHLEGGEGGDGLVHILYVSRRVLGPVQHHGGVVNEWLLCRVLVWQRWLLQRVGG